MQIEGLVYADDDLIRSIEDDETLTQVANVATLPGMVGRSLVMPDAHLGYGFAIGGVAAADLEHGVVSAGGVGFDINCGVRLLATPWQRFDVGPHLDGLLNRLFQTIPCGAGRSGMLSLGATELTAVLLRGARWAVEQGFGGSADLEHAEEAGCMAGADPDAVSTRARQRGTEQLGTLGSGNHFVEVQYVDKIFDDQAAAAYGLRHDQVVVMIHSGSRGLGHQVCTDSLEVMQEAMPRYGIHVTDRQLACVPVRSPEGQRYLHAMAAAANFAFANRQLLSHRVREACRAIMGPGDVRLVYDVAHNIAKEETHQVGGRSMRVLVHRKGATRAFPRRHPEIPTAYREIGQPVLIPGSMGTASYVLVGTERAMEETFGSTCHGAGRSMSRHAAKKGSDAEALIASLKAKGIHVRGASRSGLVEEKPDAYKDIDRVVEIVHQAGIAAKVARLAPIGVIKG